MLVYKIQYFNKFGFLHSQELINIPVDMVVGANQDQLTELILSKRKYTTMDFLITCEKGHEIIVKYIPYLYKIKD